MKHFYSSFILALVTLASFATVHDITNINFTFYPDNITVMQGDTIIWTLDGYHNVNEVSEANWYVNMSTFNDGFLTPYGGGMVIMDVVGTFFYVSTPDASIGMKGSITVEMPQLEQMNLPVNFDESNVDYSTVDFGGNASSFVNDPTGGTNQVVQTIKSNTAQLWAGTTLATPGPPSLGFLDAIPFTASATTMSLRVYSPDAGIPIRLKVEDETDPTRSVETQSNTTVAGAWETLTFDFSVQAPGTAALNLSYRYDKASVFFNFGTEGAVAGEKTYYWDDMAFGGGDPVTLQMNLPVNFDESNVDYSTVDFGGNASSFVNDPTGGTNQVVQTIKSNTAQLWAGTTLATEGPPSLGFLDAIPFTASATTMSLRVYSPDAGIPIRLKVEDETDPTRSVETQSNTTVAGAWETLTLDFSVQAAGTAALNLSYRYDKASVFFNFGTEGAVAGEKTYYWDDMAFGGGDPVTLQMNLPVNFDESNVDYSTVDFGGNASSFVTDPTGGTNQVVQTIKSNTAQLWAGTTLATEGSPSLGFLDAIPFTASATTMSLRVYSPDAGIPIRLKVEDETDPTRSVETQSNTTVAGAWETLTFDFSVQAPGTAALNLSYRYDKASVFFNFGTEGAVAGEKTYYWDDMAFGGGDPVTTQMNLPVNFDESNVDYSTVDFGGNASSFVNDPTGGTNQVVQTIKSNTAQLWAGTTLATEGPPSLGFLDAIPFTASATTMSLRVYSPDAGIPIRLKVEDETDPTRSVETQSNTTVAGAWETLTFDFSVQAPGTAALNLSYRYDKASVFFNFGTEGAVAGEKTYYWDDMAFGGGDPVTLQMNLPVNFDESNVDYSTVDFGGNASSFVNDPTGGTNQVVQTTKSNTAQLWAGTTLATPGPPSLGFLDAIPFTASATTMSLRVYSPDIGIPIRLKVEDETDPTRSVETQSNTTVAGAWETLTFDFSVQAPGTAALNLSFRYDKASVFFNFGTEGAVAGEKTYYWDDMAFGGGDPVSLQMNLPVNFDESNVDYSTVDFGGNASSFVNDPTGGINQVVQTIKSNTAQLWAGTTLATPGPPSLGFLDAIPFAASATTMSLRVYSPDAGIPIRLKVEDETDPTKSVETQTNTTVAGAWETLTFDFSVQAPGTAALNLSYRYDKASVFFNFGTEGAVAGEKTYYWDDMAFGGGDPVTQQMNLPVNFDESNVDYSTVDFGGNASSFVNDPTGGTNQVVQTIKSNTAQLWAGTTLATPGPPSLGFLDAIPFTASATTMSLRVYSPDAGIPIRLKVEDETDPTKSVETETNTTVAGAWETLTFDFSVQAPGTAALNLSYRYDKASVFFNFGTEGAVAGEKTYYWDDMAFGGGDPVTLQMNLPVNFDESNVAYSTVDFGGNTSSFVTDPTGGTNQVVQTIKSNTAQLWAGTTLATPGPPSLGFLDAIPFTASATTISLRVYSPDAGIPIRLKVEDETDPTRSVETQSNTTVAGAWETLTFDFSVQAPGTAALNLSYRYDKASVFFNFGTEGAVAGEKTYYWDDMAFGGGDPVTLQMNLPVNFDESNVAYSTVDFGGNASSFVNDPTGGTNQVVQTIKSNTAQLWAGTTLATPGPPSLGFLDAIPFTASATTMSLRVYSPDAGIPIRLKVEDETDPTKSVETQTNTTVAGAWETLTFDFSVQAAGTAALNLSFRYDKASVFFNFGTEGAVAGEKTYYWDDMAFGGGDPVTQQMNLPVNFDESNVAYSTVDFGGNASSFVNDPTGGTNQVVQTIKSNTAQLWAGTTLATEGSPSLGFLDAIPFTASATSMSLRVYSPDAGIPIRLKVEDETDPTRSVETQSNTTVAGAWETLTFDFSVQAPGTAALNLSYRYDKASVFFNFGTEGAVAGEKTYYWDDMAFGGGDPVTLQMNLPVNFDESNVAYSTVDFGGNASSFVNDPTGGTNQVVQTIKSNTAQLWAGTTLATPGPPSLGFLDAIPFTASATTMSLRVYSPDAGIPIRLKVEDETDPTKSVETQSNTTVAGAWETLTFDFSVQAPGTAALNLSYRYDKASVFFNFGTEGAVAGEKTYYWDDMAFGGGVSGPCDGVVDNPMIFEDFECQRHINYSFTHGTLTVINNPGPDVVNSTDKVGSYTRNSGEEFDVIVAEFETNLDLSTDDQIHMDVWTSASIDIVYSFQDNGGNVVTEITKTTAGASAWETLDLDLSNFNDNTTIAQVVVLFEPGSFTSNTYFLDNFILDGVAPETCTGVIPDQDILDDFNCQTNISYTFANATWNSNVQNPLPSGINTSSLVGEFIHFGAGTDGAFGGSLDLGPISLTTDNQLKLDILTNARNIPIVVVFQDGTGTDILSQTQITYSVGVWHTLTFDMSAATSSIDFANIVFVVNAGSTVQDTVYFDNIRLEGFVDEACENVVPDKEIMEDFDCQRNIDYQFTEGGFVTFPNPDMSGINTSVNVGKYTRNNTVADAFGGDFTLAPLDFSSNNQIKMNIWDANAPSTVTIVLQNAGGVDVGTAVSSSTIANEWQDLNFDFSATPNSAVISKVVILFDSGSQADSNNIYYFDNLRLDGLLTGIRDITQTDIKVFPNPAKDRIAVYVSDIEIDAGMTVTILSVNGEIIYVHTINENSEMIDMDIRTLDNGIYIIEIANERFKWTNKFVKIN